MSKITIASAVLAGLSIADRLNDLEIKDHNLASLVGDLASSLGSVMATVEKVDVALSIVGNAIEDRDDETALKGIEAIQAVVADLVSDQEKIVEAMLVGLSEEEAMLVHLMAAVGGIGSK